MIDAASPVSRDPLPASLRSPAVLAATAGLAAGVGVLQTDLAAAVLRAGLVAVLVACTLVDLDRRLIPNRITGPAAVSAVLVGLALDPAGEPARLLWSAVAGSILLLAALLAPAGMGMGDVKLVAVMGLLLGPPVIVALFAALLVSALAGVALIARHGLRAARRATLPFGPFLAGGGVLAALLGARVLHAYLGLHGA
jgi:leader peptidase (prepilin peptidase)/N-methyltransferase